MRDDIFEPEFLRAIEARDDYRLLRRLEVAEGLTGVGRRDGTSVGVVVDVETTGINDDDVIIELALRRFRFDPDGVIVKVDRPYSWLQDPGRELTPEIVALTGLTDADLAGQEIDEGAATRLLGSAEFVCAHNAPFDRGMVERRLEDARGIGWACSCNDVDWRAIGFDGRSLGWLLAQIGFFHGAHRAGDDVDAVIALLGHSLPAGGTVLAQMLARARESSWRFGAIGAAFDLKDRLKARGYRWDGADRCWWREVPDARKSEEEWWLAGHVYSIDAHPKALGPIIEPVTWRERYAPRHPMSPL
ncbi:3'-5' exonuclease [Sphingomonas sp. AR_OL41]|uniref:3'-5' exonuclease n=1 Tax=Sphingomonas sp. AR_OL41 TaxID=3042729 RepID=UPI00247FDFA8|nr:3'-5' exonuclease [Sphingomonas sp. AR_OL41]MDH7971268.1 3'-5' exonuclease [Sphingomonas sp. AR_OL41]